MEGQGRGQGHTILSPGLTMMMIDYELWIELSEKRQDRFAAITSAFDIEALKRVSDRAPARCRGTRCSTELVESGIPV